jgi:ubiquinone/menaquinone biosynthesis C-methylase UbiE
MKSQFEEQYRLYEKDWWWFAGRHDLVSKLSTILLSENNKVLEIGCSSGENSKIFNSSVDYYGIDISPSSINAGNHDNKNLIIGEAGHIPFQDKSFHAVLFLDVLEHLEDEKSAISEAYRVLRDGGSLLILVPAFEFLWSGHDVLNQHKRRYTKSEIATRIVYNKFSICRISYWNFFLFLPIALMKKIKEIINTEETADFTQIPNTLNSVILTNLLKIENYLIYKGINLPIGVSILCVCKK